MQKFIIACLASIPLLTGCDTIDSHHAREDQQNLVSMSKVDFYSCAGLPNRSQSVNGMEYDTWDYEPYSADSFTLPVIGGLSFGTGTCHTTAIFKGDKISEIDYAGDTGGILGHVAECETIVSHCENDMKPATGKY